MRIALVGTELACVGALTGGLEKLVRGWGRRLSYTDEVLLVDCAPLGHLHHDSPDLNIVSLHGFRSLPEVERIFAVDVTVLNNRPQVTSSSPLRVDLFHNFSNAWNSTQRELSELGKSRSERRFAAVSHALSRHVSEVFGIPATDVSVVSPFVDEIFFSQDSPGGSSVLFAGRLMKKKGVELALAACVKAGVERDAHFIDTTTEYLKDSAEYRRLRDKITASRAALLPEALSPAEMAEHYKSAGVVLTIATEPEGLGLVPLEAQAMNRPVLTVGSGGLEEATLPPNIHLQRASTNEIANELLRAISDSTARNTREKVRARFQLDVSTQALRSLWTDNSHGSAS